MNKSVYLGLSTLEISKIIIYEFWYDYVKPKYGEKAKLYYMDRGSYIFYIKTENIYSDISKDFEATTPGIYSETNPLPSITLLFPSV